MRSDEPFQTGDLHLIFVFRVRFGSMRVHGSSRGAVFSCTACLPPFLSSTLSSPLSYEPDPPPTPLLLFSHSPPAFRSLLSSLTAVDEPDPDRPLLPPFSRSSAGTNERSRGLWRQLQSADKRPSGFNRVKSTCRVCPSNWKALSATQSLPKKNVSPGTTVLDTPDE